MVRTKVFVGNLSFATKETELAKHFEVAGKVISTNIITRGPRSLGYGFVEMENEADAENAVKLLDKKDIDGRPINVEVAKPREDNANAQQDQSQPQGAASNRGGNRGGRGGRRGGSSRGGRGGKPQGANQGQAPQQGQSNQGQAPQQGTRGRGGARRGGAPRAPRAVKPEDDNRTASTTTLFVASLPFSLDDEGFAKVLKDNNLAYKTAHVVKKKTGRSKGFGFIDFENEADQQKALAALDKKTVDNRELVVKVALTGAPMNEASGAADAVAPTNKPSAVKAAVAAATTPAAADKKDDKPAPKQEQKK